jgi:hypothetical protein
VDSSAIPENDEEPPSAEAILHRALTFAMEGLQAADVQLQRARQDSSDGPGGAFQWWIDLQFFIVALRRLRKAADLGSRVSEERQAIQHAIRTFDEELPNLHLLRNVGEHIDDYAVDEGHDPSVRWRQLQVGGWDGKHLNWLGVQLDTDQALEAGRKLVGEIEWARVRQMQSQDQTEN